MPILPDDFVDPILQELIGETSMIEITKSHKHALSLNGVESDVNALFLKAVGGINIFGGTEIAALLDQLIRRWFEECAPISPPA